MAEIRSTMDMVLERAARLEAAASDAADTSEQEKEGMRLGARYLRNEDEDIPAALEAIPAESRAPVMKGMVTVLLRNITLPRDPDDQAGADKAMQGLMGLGRGNNELAAVFQEMKSILDRYLTHKDQLRQQLEDQFAQQMGMMEESLTQQTGVQIKLEPSQHPKFAEEWQRVMTEMNEQYGRALKQYKEFISQRLTGK